MTYYSVDEWCPDAAEVHAATAFQTFCTDIIPRNQSRCVQLPCPNHNCADPDTDHTVTIPSVSLRELRSQGPCWSSTLITAGWEQRSQQAT